MGRAAILAAATSLALFALPSVAAAQAPGSYGPPGAYQPPPTGPVVPAYAPPEVRRGLVLGFGIGGGSITPVDDSGAKDEQFEGMSFELHIGGMLTPQLALLGEIWAVTHHSDEEDITRNGELTLTHNIAVLAAQYWLTPRFWIKGGIGRASYTVEDDFGTYESEDAPAVMGGLGYELSHSRTFAIDLQLRFGSAEYEEGQLQNGAFVVGLNWY